MGWADFLEQSRVHGLLTAKVEAQWLRTLLFLKRTNLFSSFAAAVKPTLPDFRWRSRGGERDSGAQFLANLVYQGCFQLQRRFFKRSESSHLTSALPAQVHSSAELLLMTVQSQQCTNHSPQATWTESDVQSPLFLQSCSSPALGISSDDS